MKISSQFRAIYDKGCQAYHAGFSDTENPFKGFERQVWFDGYYDTKHDLKFGKLFQTYGLMTMKQEREAKGYSFQTQPKGES